MTVVVVATVAVALLSVLRARDDLRWGMYSTTSWGISFVVMAIACTLYAGFWVRDDWSLFGVAMILLLISSLVRNAGLRRRIAASTKESQ